MLKLKIMSSFELDRIKFYYESKEKLEFSKGITNELKSIIKDLNYVGEKINDKALDELEKKRYLNELSVIEYNLRNGVMEDLG